RSGGVALDAVAAPAQEDAVVLDDLVAAVVGVVRRQRVRVEDEDAARREPPAHRPQRADEVVVAEQVADGVVEAGDEVEGAEVRELAHVGLDEAHADWLAAATT